MNAARRCVAEINRLKSAIEKTKSEYLKRDYTKNLNTMIADLQEYCGYRGFDFDKILRGE